MTEATVLAEQQLAELRISIDHLDTAFIFLLSERARLITQISTFKQQLKLPNTYSSARQDDLKKIFDLATQRQLNHHFLEHFFQTLYQHTLEHSSQSPSNNPDILSETKGLEKVNELRASIYNIDIALCHLLAERFNVSRRVGKVKKEYNIPPLVESRWHKILQSKTRLAKKLHIDPTLIQSLLELIHRESLRIQNEIISN